MRSILFILIFFFLSAPLFAGDLLDEFSGFYHSPVILEVDEQLDRFGHPEKQWLASVIRGSQAEVEAVQKGFKIEKGPKAAAVQRRVLLFGKNRDGSFHSMEGITQGRPVEKKERGYEDYKSWLGYLDRYLSENRDRLEKGGKDLLVIRDPGVCERFRSSRHFQSRYGDLLKNPEGFRLGGGAGDFQGRFVPLLALNCRPPQEVP